MTGRQTNRMAGKQADSQSGRQTDRQPLEKTNGQMQKTIYIVERKKVLTAIVSF